MNSSIVILLTLGIFCSASIINKNVSRSIQGRIIGGQAANAGEFPFATAIYYKTETGNYFYGGSLVNNHWILTGGHCVNGASQFTIHLGTTKLNGNEDSAEVVTTISYIVHPLFDVNTFDNDIGLILLRAVVEFSDYIQPVGLPSAELGDNIEVTAIGWGSTNDQTSSLSNVLNFVKVSSLSNNECKLIYGSQLTDNMVCVDGNYNEGACRGDIGGPIVTEDSSVVGKKIHVGISSFISGNGCETTDPSGYTRTFPYVEWIKTLTGLDN